MAALGQNEPCYSLRRHGRSTSVSRPAGSWPAIPGRAQPDSRNGIRNFPPANPAPTQHNGSSWGRPSAAYVVSGNGSPGHWSDPVISGLWTRPNRPPCVFPLAMGPMARLDPKRPLGHPGCPGCHRRLTPIIRHEFFAQGRSIRIDACDLDPGQWQGGLS